MHPRGEAGFIKGSGCKTQHGFCGASFGGVETIAVHFQEEHTGDEPGALVPIDKGVVLSVSRFVVPRGLLAGIHFVHVCISLHD